MLDSFIDNYIIWIAVYGALLSTLAIILNFKIIRRDVGRLAITGMMGKVNTDIKGRVLVSDLFEEGKTCLSFKVSYIGRRPIRACTLVTKEKFFSKSETVVFCQNLPITLDEGRDVVEIFFDFSCIENEPCSIYVTDSLGKKHRMKRKVRLALYRSYRHLIQNGADQESTVNR